MLQLFKRSAAAKRICTSAGDCSGGALRLAQSMRSGGWIAFANSATFARRMSPHHNRTFWQLCCEEPFRIFFPLGALVGISGVSLWPLYFTGIHEFYPGVMHARMMIQGFMAAFILGFLGTAAPRLLGAPHLTSNQLRVLLVLYAAAVGLHIGHQHFIADWLFLFLLLLFTAHLGRGFLCRTDAPPPFFVLVGFGLLNGIGGVALLIAGAASQGNPRAAFLGALLLYQGFVLNLLLGVGGFLMPRLMGLNTAEEAPASRQLPPGWRTRALFAGVIGLALLASFIMETFASLRLAALLRSAAIVAFLLSAMPLQEWTAARSSITRCAGLALLLLIAGFICMIFWPIHKVAAEHVVFIGGMTLITFAVATRVILGHSGGGKLGQTRLPFLTSAALLLVAAAALRLAGDLLPESRATLLNTASYLWMLAAAVWGWRMLSKIRTAPDEDP